MGTDNQQSGDRMRLDVDDDSGMTIIEVLVSAVILVTMLLATLAVLDRASALSSDNRARSVATALAQQDQDMVRQWPFAKVSGMFAGNNADGQTQNVYATPKDVNIDNVHYTVQTELKVVSDSEQNTACLADWQNRKIQITTTATPPPGNKLKPVQMRTFRVPTVLSAANKGSVIVRLTRGNGDPTGGVPVMVTGQSQKNTDPDGCAVFSDVTTGSVTISWGAAGGSSVDENGADLITRTITLLGGATAQFAGRFDTAKSPTIKFVDETGSDTTPDGKPIMWNSVSVVNPGISTVYNGWRSWTFPSASSFTIPGLFPFESSYGVFAGTCWGNDPTIWGAPSVTSNAVLINSSAPSTANVVMQKVTFTLPGAGYRVYVAPEGRVTKMGGGKCTPRLPGNFDSMYAGILPASPPANYTQAAPVKTTPTGGSAPPNVIQYALPWGIWRVCADNGAVRTKKIVRISNTPAGTPGTPGETRDYVPVTSATYVAGDFVAGTCSSNPTVTPWLDWNQKQNRTDP